MASSPARSRVLRLLFEGPQSPGTIAAALNIAPGTASNHLAALHGLGLVTAEACGRRRFYSAVPNGAQALLEEIRGPANDPAADLDRR
ncbi:helix-turn-helix domain-containing protein [Arthrobacter sp. S39]|uniref:ArsR/SmtB family transcription factor n=1 Tax=Paenarthrobacter sp. 2TAF44 TaxID=3233018 RepID=UPI0013EFA889